MLPLRAVRVHLFKLTRSERWLLLWRSWIGVDGVEGMAPLLPSTSGVSAHRLIVYGNRSASCSRRSGVSSSLLGKRYLPSLVPLHCWLLSLNLVGSLLLTPSKKGGVEARRSPGRLQSHKGLGFICGSLVVVCRLGARTDRLPSLLCRILA